MASLAGLKRKAAEEEPSALSKRDVTHFMSFALQACNGDTAAAQALRDFAPSQLAKDTPVEDDLPYWKSLACSKNPGREETICNDAPSKRYANFFANPSSPDLPKRQRPVSRKASRGRPRKEQRTSTPRTDAKSRPPSSVKTSIEAGSDIKSTQGTRSSARTRNTNVIYNAKIHPQDHALRPAAWKKRISGPAADSSDVEESDEGDVSDAGDDQESDAVSAASEDDDVGAPSVREQDSKATRFSTRLSTQKYIDYNRFHHPQDKQLGIGHGPRKSSRTTKPAKVKHDRKALAKVPRQTIEDDSDDDEEETIEHEGRTSHTLDAESVMECPDSNDDGETEEDEETKDDHENNYGNKMDKRGLTNDQRSTMGSSEESLIGGGSSSGQEVIVKTHSQAPSLGDDTRASRLEEEDVSSALEPISTAIARDTDSALLASQLPQAGPARSGKRVLIDYDAPLEMSYAEILGAMDDVTATFFKNTDEDFLGEDNRTSRNSSAAAFHSVRSSPSEFQQGESGESLREHEAFRSNEEFPDRPESGAPRAETTSIDDQPTEDDGATEDNSTLGGNRVAVQEFDGMNAESTLSQGTDEDEQKTAPVRDYESQEYYVRGPNGASRRLDNIVHSQSQTVCPADLDKSRSDSDEGLMFNEANFRSVESTRPGPLRSEHLSPTSRDTGPVLYSQHSRQSSSACITY